MKFFNIQIPPLPNDKFIYDLHSTPLIKLIKFLLLCVVIAYIFVVVSLFSMSLKSPSLIYLVAFIDLVIKLCFGFAFYCVGRLSKRATILRFYLFVILADLVAQATNVLLDSKESVLVYGFCYGLSVAFFLKICNELSFVTHNKFFALFIKCFIAFFACVIVAFMLAALEPIMLVFASAAVVFGIAGVICYIRAIVNLSLIVEYGENVPNPL